MKKLLFFIAIVVMAACSNSQKKQQTEKDNNPFPMKYENELFSVNYPKGWICDDSGWLGLDSMTNEVNIYNPDGDVVSFHFVKAFLNIQWKDINEVVEMAKSLRYVSGDSVVLFDEIDSIDVGGYPSHILCYADPEDPDTLIQKQYVTYMEDSHIILYFNEMFYYRNSDKAQDLGDALIETIKLKKIKNPLDDDKVMQNSINSALENGKIDMDKGKKIMDEIEKVVKK